MTTKWDYRFLRLAEEIAIWSKDPSTKVGAVIVRPDNTIASTGYNGFPMNMADKPEYLDNREEKYSRVVHGEMNAILFARESVNGYTLYTVPFMPCDRCFVHVAQAGIVRVVFPKCPEDKMIRWKDAFDKVRRYAEEVGIELTEVEEKHG